MPKSRTSAPRTTSPAPAARPVDRAQGLTAAARRLSGRPDMSKISKSAGRGWQHEAWQFYDTIGEYRYGVDWKASMLSRATLYLAKDDERAVEDDSMAQAYLGAFFGGEQVVGQMLREVGTHLEVAGECYVVGVTRDGVERWMVVASTELTARGGAYYMWGKKVESDTEPLVLRVWRPHPRRWTEANSPTRAILPVLSEVDQLTKFVSAQIDSRLAGAGILFVPSEMQLPAGQIAESEEGEPVAQAQAAATAFVGALTTAMMASLTDRESASSVVPIVATGPGDAIGNVQHVTFWSELQEQAKELRDEAIRRLGLGMDLPAEVVLGTGDTNHWNAWKIDEAAIKVHAEPLLALICESLTTGYLRPLLIDDGMEPIEAERYSIKADTAALRLRPDRSQEALELYDRGAISLDALLREVGFDPDDAPDPAQFAAWLIKKIAQGQTTPELVEAAARVLGADIGPVVSGDDTGTSPGHQARPTPSLEAHPYEGPPRRTTTAPPGTSPVAAAAEVIVYRALERAGNRLRTKIGKPLAQVPACEAYLHVPVRAADCEALLDDAFTNLDRYQICRQVPAERLEAALDSYCRYLLVSRTTHSTAALQEYLDGQLALEVAR
jgi:hypothetical protein